MPHILSYPRDSKNCTMQHYAVPFVLGYDSATNARFPAFLLRRVVSKATSLRHSDMTGSSPMAGRTATPQKYPRELIRAVLPLATTYVFSFGWQAATLIKIIRKIYSTVTAQACGFFWFRWKQYNEAGTERLSSSFKEPSCQTDPNQ